MNRTIRLCAVGVVALALTACSGGGGNEGGESPSRRFLQIGTAPPGGAFFVVGGALAETLSEKHREDGWTVTAEATKGSQENIRRLASGELDFALANSAITYHAVRGEGAWEQAYEVAVVATLAPNVAFFVTQDDSGIESMGDLAGRRVTVGPAGAGFEYFLGPLLAAHGVSYDDFSPLNATQAGAVGMLQDGSAAAAFLGGAIPTASITQAASTGDVRFVPFDPEARARLMEDYLFFRPATVPAGTYRGQSEDFEGLDVGSMHLITRADADAELVYQVVKTLYENREAVAGRHPAGRALGAPNVVRDTGTPFHSGAERYFKEAGIWPG